MNLLIKKINHLENINTFHNNVCFPFTAFQDSGTTVEKQRNKDNISMTQA